MRTNATPAIEYALLGLLAVLWGSSYILIGIAVTEITPITLIALRVGGAAVFLALVMIYRRQRMPREPGVWAMFGVQAVFNSIGAWTVLAWGQQYVSAGLASVLNSTSPIFVFAFTALFTSREVLGRRQLAGAVIGLAGVILIVGIDTLNGLGVSVGGQLACLLGAIFYAGAAIYGRRLAHVGALQTAFGTMVWATAVLTPLAFVVEDPAALRPGFAALGAAMVLAVLCTGTALLIYFRLVRTLGPLGVASQSYLRAGVGVVLGAVFLGEIPTLPVALGLVTAILGVALINTPVRRAGSRG